MSTDIRPDDVGELARLVAIELRKRGIRASEQRGHIKVGYGVLWSTYSLRAYAFGNAGLIASAHAIQREEARRAQEWAGDT